MNIPVLSLMLAQLHAQSAFALGSNSFPDGVHLLLRHRLGRVSVRDSVAVACLISLLVFEDVNQFHFLHDISVELANQIVEVIRVVIGRNPKGNVVDQLRLLADSLKQIITGSEVPLLEKHQNGGQGH